MRNIIGFVMAAVGLVLGGATGIIVFYGIMLAGVFLFVSFPSEATFYDYRIANSNVTLLRKRHYMNFIPFTIISLILTLGKSILLIPWKEEYFKKDMDGDNPPTPISREEYITLRNRQREIYSTQILPREFMEEAYTEESIGFKRKKARLIAAVVLAALMLTMVILPGGISLSLIYGAVFLPMVILWIPAYKDAKILQSAYEKAFAASNQNTPLQ